MDRSCGVLTREDCLQVARKYFGSEDVEVSGWQEKKLSDKPAGYLGEHMLADIHASSGKHSACINVFVKTLPSNENQATLIVSTGAFRKETLFYQKLYSAWEERGIISSNTLSNKISDGNGDDKDVDWNCRCYVARDNVVVLENLIQSGYKSDSARNPFSYEDTVIAMKMLASYHAASIIYEEQRAAELKRPFRISEEFPELVKETFYLVEEGHPGEQTTEAGVEGILASALLLPICEDPDVRRRVQERLPDVLRQMYNAVKTSSRFRNVLCHADLWQNNILLRRSNGTAVGAKLVDFQLLRYVPPAHDIFDLLYLSTRREMREKNEQELLDVYYAALGASLQRHGLDIDIFLPREDFDASLEDQRFLGRLSGVYVLHFILSDEEAIGPVFDDPAEYARVVWEGDARARFICLQFEKDPIYRERYFEVLMELLEKHVL